MNLNNPSGNSAACETSAVKEKSVLPEKKKKSKKKIILTIAFVIMNVIVVGYTAIVEFTKERPAGKVGINFGIINIICLICAFLCLGVVLGVETVKYLLMMRSLGEKVSLRHAFQVSALGKYYDSITPTGAGGQPFQIWYMHSNGYSSGASAAIPLSGFLTMQFGFIFLAAAVFIFNNAAVPPSAFKISAYVGILFYLIMPVMIVLFALFPKAISRFIMFFVRVGARLHFIKKPFITGRKIMRSLGEYSSSIAAITRDRLLLVKLLGLSVIYHIALCSIPFFVIRTFGGSISYINALSVCVFIYSATTYIPTPGNSGAAEGAFYGMFSSIGTSGIFWAMLVWRLVCYYSFLVIGLLIYTYNAFIGRRIKKAESIKDGE